MLIETLCENLKKAVTTNSTDGTYPTRIPTITEPAGPGVYSISGDIGPSTPGLFVNNGIYLIPYGTGSSNQTFAMKIIGWSVLPNPTLFTNSLWIPTPIAEFACTLGTAAGVAGMGITSTELFVDTITLVAGDPNDTGVTIHIYSPADNTIAHATVDLEGCQKVEVIFQLTNVTDMNCLIRLI